MTFAGVVIGCWLAIATVAFLAISALGRLAARGDVDAQLGIVGDAELRVLVSERHEEHSALELLRERFAVEASASNDLGSLAA
jgi:hypothetical protein